MSWPSQRSVTKGFQLIEPPTVRLFKVKSSFTWRSDALEYNKFSRISFNVLPSYYVILWLGTLVDQPGDLSYSKKMHEFYCI